MDDWKQDLAAGVRRAADLDRLPLSEAERAGVAATADAFKVRAPASYLARIDWSDPADPVRLQVVPDARELDVAPGERADPIGDAAYSPVPRLTHRYPGRALLYPTYQCAVYCRHCFRKEDLNDGNRGFSPPALEDALAYIASHPEIREVILTGGDPLLLPDDGLAWLRDRIAATGHVRLLRVHTRVPVVLPGRVTDGLVAALRGAVQVAVVLHVNHARELGPEAEDAARALREAGFMLLNQAVLLRGVNDSADALTELFEALVYRLGCKPYYLHHCDLTRGLSHLRVPLDRGQALMAALRGRVSGLCLPEYVLDLPGGDGKIPVGPSFVEAREGHRWLFRGWRGGLHPYDEVPG